MNPLRVALVNRVGSEPGRRSVGWWAYPVPEFEMKRFPVVKGQRLDRSGFGEFDCILWEDGKSEVAWHGEGPPILYHVVDSTLSEYHYRHRLAQAKQCDAILLDWDTEDRWSHLGKPILRFGYCVDDRLFRDWGLPKDRDVCCHCRMDSKGERGTLMGFLHRFCTERNYVYADGTRVWLDYAVGFNRSRISVNLDRTSTIRSHRIMDVMASHSCLVTSPMPQVPGEHFVDGKHYASFRSHAELGRVLEKLLESGDWRRIADAGHAEVMARHTWAVRASELRERIAGLL